jgi:deoxyribodipyrimidine photo-lyase
MWFRRDLRLDDHAALAAAASAGPVVPLFVTDPAFDRSGAPRRAFLTAALHGLNADIIADGGAGLVCRRGDPVDVVPRVAAEVGAALVVVTRDFAPYGRRRDAAVAARLVEHGAALRGVGSNYAVEPGRVTKADGTPYTVFTPFLRAWASIGWGPPVERPAIDWAMPSRGLGEIPPPAAVTCTLPPATSADVDRQWSDFRDARLDDYGESRNAPGVDGTSRLSAALRWGLVHPRRLLADLRPEPSHDTFRSELAWREFYADVLFRRPETAWRNFDPRMDAMPVDDAPERLAAWAAGRTGYPIVDAGMRELLATGWMHNRVRMIAASFLVKDLHLPWQWGARHFMQHLVDGDLASNAHGWQWTAGTGTDAAPYFRIFNPTTQSLRFDPHGVYLRRWLPELAGLDDREIHEPRPSRADGYPPAIVDHAVERVEALRRYEHVRAGSR